MSTTTETTSPGALGATEAPEETIRGLRARIDTLLEERGRLNQNISRLECEEVPPNDSRVRHIWVAAARAADEENFCGEYDRLAEALGVPTRDDLREAGELDSTYTVRTLVTIEVNLEVETSSEDAAIDAIDRLSIAELREKLGNVCEEVHQTEIDSWDAQEAELVED